MLINDLYASFRFAALEILRNRATLIKTEYFGIISLCLPKQSFASPQAYSVPHSNASNDSEFLSLEI